MSFTMRQLRWAAIARQRAEWDRFARLLNLVDCRTIFDKATQPVPFDEWYPPGLIDRRELMAARQTKQVPSMAPSEVAAMLGLTNGRK